MDYAELHCRSNFSFQEGASHASELMERAAELGYSAVAVTDRDTLAGMVRAHMAAADCGVKLIVGAEVHFEDSLPAVVWTTDRASYGRLCRLLTVGRQRAEKGRCRLLWEDWARHQQGLLAGLLPPPAQQRPQPKQQQRQQPRPRLAGELARWRELMGNRLYLLAHALHGPDDRRRLLQLDEIARRRGVPLVAAGDVRYHAADRKPLHDVLTAVKLGATVDQARGRLTANGEHHLRSRPRIQQALAALPGAAERTLEVAARCRFSLNELRYEYPLELAPEGMTTSEHLRQLAWSGARRQYPAGVPEKVRRLLEHELQLIAELQYEAYFLTVWDLVRFARSRGILCQGRGSAANSAVCYCLGVTSVDPQQSDVLFERFISRERNEAPDIDVDFEHQRREEVLQYLYDKYGRERAGMTAAVTTYRGRSAVRDVGKALGLSPDAVDRLAKNLDGRGSAPLAERCRQVGIDPASPLGRRLVALSETLVGFPRHLSQHVGGMVITRGPLCELAPIENAAMPGRTVLQWDKDDLDELGILKIDCLSLGMLTAIHKCFDLVRRHWQRPLTLASVPAEDPVVYDMICQADTMGVFQIESRAQMSMLPRLRPRCYYDLVIEVAIVRPGPIQGDMVHPYLRRRAGEEPVRYPNKAVREVLHKTLGVPLFQEQAMRLAVVAAGFTPGEADRLRRAMGAWRRPGVIDQFRRKLVDGMRRQGLAEEFAEQVFHQIRGFGEYGFPESHAASFAKLVYVSAWLKRHYPAAFLAALLNSQPMGFYAPAQLVRDAREHQVQIRPADVNFSRWDCTLEREEEAEAEEASDGNANCKVQSAKCGISRAGKDSDGSWAVRLGLRMLRGLPEAAARRLEQARQAGGAFRSLDDLSRRTRLGAAALALLAEADALHSLGRSRREALWESLAHRHDSRAQPLLQQLEPQDDPPVRLPELSEIEQVFADYRAAGLSLRGHPLQFYRRQLTQLDVVPAGELRRRRHDEPVCVAGLVLLRQRPSTAKGITFVTLEDETGAANLVVHQSVWEQFGMVARHSPAWLARGRLERRGAAIHVVARQLEDLSQLLGDLHTRSRDFR